VAIERWDEEGRRRLLIVNFGDELEFDLALQDWMGHARGLAWRPVLCTSDAIFAGPGIDLESLTLEGGEVVMLPPRSATRWFAEE
jgi:hypothetical protein